MADKMYHNITGWHEEDEKHRGMATHMLLSIEEYETLCDERNEAIRARNKMASDAKAYKEKVDTSARVAIRDANDNAAAQIEQMRVRMETAEAEAERQTNLNRNLLRITRERANAKRGLQPKKTHDGYRFTGKIMQTKTICGHDKKEGAIYTDVWTATIETPYDATIPIHQIKDHIFNDLRSDGGILEKLYIKSWIFKESGDMWKGTYLEALENAERFDMEGKNILFDYKMMANPKTGLWEIQITTTKSIRALKEMMA